MQETGNGETHSRRMEEMRGKRSWRKQPCNFRLSSVYDSLSRTQIFKKLVINPLSDDEIFIISLAQGQGGIREKIFSQVE